MARNVEVDIHEDAIHELLLSDDTRDMLHDIGDEVSRIAQGLAPHLTGYGAHTIHTEMDLVADNWEANVSWSWPNAYYMYWHELGSRQLPPRPILVPALRAAS
jgi:hypothetical protein